MNIVIAPDSFKGSLSALAAAKAIATGTNRVFSTARCHIMPMADGGEGSAQVLVDTLGGHYQSVTVNDPLGRPVQARYGVLATHNTAVIEMAEASGLVLLGNNKQALRASTYGTGELIRHAIDQGLRKLVIGVGGSATTDAGMGMAQALGVVFYNHQGQRMDAPGCGALLGEVARIDTAGLHGAVADTEIIVACDVDNPLYGEQGAARMFSAQKGASVSEISQLDAHLKQYAHCVERELGVELGTLPRAGAAGGLAAGLRAFAQAKLVSGIDYIMQATQLEPAIAAADLVITGEGQIDQQTLHGKVPAGVAALAKRHGVPVIALGGSLASEARSLFAQGLDGLEPCVTRPISTEQAMANAAPALSDAAERAMRLVNIGAGM